MATALSIAGNVAAQRLPLAKPEDVGMFVRRYGQDHFDDSEADQGQGNFWRCHHRGAAREGLLLDAQGMRDIAAGKPMTKDAIFRIYSMTKAVVSVGAMILVEKGKLELDVPASNYISALGEMKVGGEPQEREMTLRDLLRHTAGFPDNVTTDRALRKAGYPSLAESTLEEMMSRLGAVPLRYQPGKGWHYSFATDVVARLVEVGSGQTLDKFLEERLFKPLGMVDTAFIARRKSGIAL